MGIRCLFFINAEYTQGELKYDIHRTYHSYSGGRYTYPVIGFETKDGTEILFTGPMNLNLDAGERVPVIYKKNHPQRACIFTFFGFWFNWLFVGGILAFAWFCLAWVLYGYK